MLSERISRLYKMSKYETVKDWKNDTNCPLSLELLTAVINRGREPSIPAAIIMLYLLDCPIVEIIEAIKDTDDTIFWRILTDAMKQGKDKE